jgi:hypothetical protein
MRLATAARRPECTGALDDTPPTGIARDVGHGTERPVNVGDGRFMGRHRLGALHIAGSQLDAIASGTGKTFL